jgi:hypothetical protein
MERERQESQGDMGRGGGGVERTGRALGFKCLIMLTWGKKMLTGNGHDDSGQKRGAAGKK